MTRSRRLAALTLTLATLVGVLAAEGIVRALHLAPPLPVEYSGYVASPYLIYGPRPFSHQQGVAATGEFRYDFRHNALGLRDVERSFAKPAGTFRVLALGDSFTYGVGAAADEAWPAVLERELNEQTAGRPAVEVIRAGVPRFFPETERLALERLGMRFSPDLVIVGFVPNDVVDTCLGLDAVTVDSSGFLMTREARALGPVGLWLYLRSHAARMVLVRYTSRRALAECPWSLPYEPGIAGHAGYWGRVEESYSRMREIARAGGAELVVLHIPMAAPWSARNEYPAARLAAWASRHGAGFVDALPAMRAHPRPETLHYRVDQHCTPAGYGVVAASVRDYLLAQGLVRGLARGAAPRRDVTVSP